MSVEKKQKAGEAEAEAEGHVFADLSSFQKEVTLFVDKNAVNVLGTFAGKPEKAVILFARENLEESDIPTILQDCKLMLDSQNTYYGFYKASQQCERRFKVTVIYPCKDWHIAKYSRQKIVILRETKEIYEKVTEAYMKKHPSSEIKWLYQLLDKTAEQDRLLLEDPDQATGFLMYAFKPKEEVLKDVPSNFKALVICHCRNLRSVRDLRTESLPLLENIMSKVTSFASSVLNIPANELRLFLHYKPTYFHLHVHVAHIEHEMHVNVKDYLLDDVIENLRICGDYFVKKTMVYPVGVKDDLYQAYVEYCSSKSP